MNRRWIYAGIGLAFAVGLARVLRPPRIRSGETRILLVGDSLAVGLGPYFSVLSKEQSVAFKQLAKQGTRIDQWAQSKALVDALESFQPTLVLISLGTNDEYLSGDGGVKQRAAAEELLRRIEQFPHKTDYGLGAEYVWISPPTLPKPTNGVRAMIESLVPRANRYPSETLTIPRGPDQIHPTAKGYAGWAGAIWQWLS